MDEIKIHGEKNLVYSLVRSEMLFKTVTKNEPQPPCLHPVIHNFYTQVVCVLFVLRKVLFFFEVQYVYVIKLTTGVDCRPACSVCIAVKNLLSDSAEGYPAFLQLKGAGGTNCLIEKGILPV